MGKTLIIKRGGKKVFKRVSKRTHKMKTRAKRTRKTKKVTKDRRVNRHKLGWCASCEKIPSGSFKAHRRIKHKDNKARVTPTYAQRLACGKVKPPSTHKVYKEDAVEEVKEKHASGAATPVFGRQLAQEGHQSLTTKVDIEIANIERKFISFKVSRDSEETQQFVCYKRSPLVIPRELANDENFNVENLAHEADYSSTESLIEHNKKVAEKDLYDTINMLVRGELPEDAVRNELRTDLRKDPFSDDSDHLSF